QNLSLSFGKRLEGFADQRARPVHAHAAADFHRHRFHRHTFFVARDQQVADVDWTSGRIHFHFHAAGGSNEHAAFTGFAERHTRSQRNHTRDVIVVTAFGSDYL